jgi:DNA-binding NarL/FixJ family response regulator
LVVEDDFLVGSQIEVALIDAGFEVVGVAQSAEEALSFAAEAKPQIVIMDIRLSGPVDGVETAIELYKARGIRCVFATAHSDSEVRRRAKSANPLGWIQKPYSMRALLEAVRGARDEINKIG